MPILPISGLPAATAPFLDADLLAIVQSGVTKKGTITQLNQTLLSAIGYTTVGNGAQYDYQTMQAAIADGKQSFYVLTDITETVDGTFSGILNIRLAHQITITFNNATPFKVTPGQEASINILCEDTAFFNYTMTSDKDLIDFSQGLSSFPSQISGNLVFKNLSAGTITAKPISTNAGQIQPFICNGAIEHHCNDSLTSYFDFNVVNISTFTTVTDYTSGAYDTKSINVSGDGIIGLYVLGSDITSTSTIATFTSTSIYRFKSYSTTPPFIDITDGAVLSGGGQYSATKFNLISSSSKVVAKNLVNCTVIPDGPHVDVMNCNLASANLSNVSPSLGTWNFNGNYFAGNINFTHDSVKFNFTNNEYNQSINVTLFSNLSVISNSLVNGDINVSGMEDSSIITTCKVGGSLGISGMSQGSVISLCNFELGGAASNLTNSILTGNKFGLEGAVGPNQETFTMDVTCTNNEVSQNFSNLAIVDNGTANNTFGNKLF